MTAVAESPVAAPAEAEATGEAANPATAEPEQEKAPVTATTRKTALAALEAAFTAFADQVILARHLTLGTHNVVDRSLCESGTKEFMTRGHLQALKRGDHPSNETQAEAAEAEDRIRAWVRTKISGDPEDYTTIGLMKQVAVVEAAQNKWRDEFRNLIISNYKSGYIKAPRMAEVLPILGMEPYETRIYATVTLTADWHAPASNFGEGNIDHTVINELLRRRIMAAMKEIAGENAQTNGCNYGFTDRQVRITTDMWRS